MIIDGIDVSECVHFNKNFENICEIYKGKRYYCFCKQYADCYYKQLQRAKAEIEAFKQSEQEGLEIIAELREKNKRLTCKILEEAALNNTLCSNCEQCEDLTKLQSENERLKEENEKLKAEIETSKIYADEFLKKSTALKAENERLKECLKEIKEIADEPCIKGENCTNCQSDCMNKEILDKISEVLND